LIAECWEEGQEGKSKWRKERGEVGVVSSLWLVALVVSEGSASLYIYSNMNICMFIVETAKDRDGISKLTVSDAMRLAGCTNEEARKNTGLRAKIDRRLKKRKKQREIEESARISQKENEVKAYAALDSTVEPVRSGADLIEPLVDTRGIQYTGSGNVGVMCLDGRMDTVIVAHAYQGTQSETFCVDSPLSNVLSYVASLYQSAGSLMATSRSLSTKPPLALPKKAKPPSISSLTTSKDHRKMSSPCCSQGCDGT
jgi:hypothetical protein